MRPLAPLLKKILLAEVFLLLALQIVVLTFSRAKRSADTSSYVENRSMDRREFLRFMQREGHLASEVSGTQRDLEFWEKECRPWPR